MIDHDALLKISYGVYVVCSGNSQQGNGFISNSVMQVTSDPAQVAVTCNKKNFSAEVITRSGALSISILPQTVSPEVMSTFGYKSGRDIDKLKNFQVRYGLHDVPVLLTDAIATLECSVKETFDVGTHLLFICEVENAILIDDTSEPITYDYYRKVRKGVSPANAPTYVDESKKAKLATTNEKHQCLVCGYVYDDGENDTPFAALGDEWVCPICGASKELFEKE
jgi:flavin reductase (DIM6/NTAB) family NADH-FMN oxidoreductase RutF/rubredoxin